MKTKHYMKPRVRVIVNDAICDTEHAGMGTTSNGDAGGLDAAKAGMTIPERALDKAIGVAKNLWDD